MESVHLIRPVLAIAVSLACAFLILASSKRQNLREFWSIFGATSMFSVILSMFPFVLAGGVYLFEGPEIAPGISLGVLSKKYCETIIIKKFWETEGQLSATLNKKELIDVVGGNRLKNMPVYSLILYKIGKVREAILDEKLEPTELLVFRRFHYIPIDIKEIVHFAEHGIQPKTRYFGE